MRALVIALCFALLPQAASASNPLLGSWRLVAAIPANEQDSSPNGIRNLRLRFGADGKATLVDPTEVLSEAKSTNAYSFAGNTLTLAMRESDELHGAVQASGDGATITFLETGMAWTLQRIEDRAIETQRLAPESVEYFPPATAADVAKYAYDSADYGKLPAGERLVGQWEVVEISGYGAGDFPPYGAPNEVWAFDGKQIRRFDRHHPEDGPAVRNYEARGALLLIQVDERQMPVPFSFDAWGRVVIGGPDGQRTVLKRINRDGKGTPVMPPLRIILGYASGSEP